MSKSSKTGSSASGSGSGSSSGGGSGSGDNDRKNGSETGLAEGLKKIFAAGVSAAFMTEESIRSYLGELKLPKEIMNVVIASAAKSKDEITQRVSKEIVGIVSQIDFVKEFSKFAETHKFKISAEIEISKKE